MKPKGSSDVKSPLWNYLDKKGSSMALFIFKSVQFIRSVCLFSQTLKELFFWPNNFGCQTSVILMDIVYKCYHYTAVFMSERRERESTAGSIGVY